MDQSPFKFEHFLLSSTSIILFSDNMNACTCVDYIVQLVLGFFRNWKRLELIKEMIKILSNVM
jgi:hypothetical protein